VPTVILKRTLRGTLRALNPPASLPVMTHQTHAPQDHAEPGSGFVGLTETGGTRMTREGAGMVYSRYAWASSLAPGRRVLEIACGAGTGLSMLRSTAKSVVGGDLSIQLLRRATSTGKRQAWLSCFDAAELPFADHAFDLVLLFEALYYMRNPQAVIREAHRVLAPGGNFAIVSANPDRPAFIRSPLAHTYHTAAEFCRVLAACGFTAEVFGTFPTAAPTRGARRRQVVIDFLRRTAERWHLVPRTLAGRALLKRLVYRNLLELPSELRPGFQDEAPRTRLVPGVDASGFKVLYVLASRA